MTAGTRWTMLFASRRGTIFASLLRNKRQSAKQAHKTELQQWENEGGNVAPATGVADTLVTTGCA